MYICIYVRYWFIAWLQREKSHSLSLQSASYFLEGSSAGADTLSALVLDLLARSALSSYSRNSKVIDTSNTEAHSNKEQETYPFREVKTLETRQAGQAMWKQLRSEYFEVCVEAGQNPGHVPKPRGRAKHVATCGTTSGAIPGSVTCCVCKKRLLNVHV